MSSTKKSNPSEKYNFWVIPVVLAALVGAFLLSTFVITVARVQSGSMFPTLKEGDWVLVNRLAYQNEKPQFGDLLVFSKKELTKAPLVKRVIGVPGDTVEIRRGLLYRNDCAVEKDFGVFEKTEDMARLIVPADCYFVLGDHRAVSKDSRYWENPFVKKKEILGKVFM